MNIGKHILDLRKAKNITQEELAAELGVTAAAVSKWENGYTLPDIMMLCALADYFGVTTDELLGRGGILKESVVVASSAELTEQIKQIVSDYGFSVIASFTEYRPALAFALQRENCKHIFIGLPQPLPKDEIADTPAEINAVHSFGDNDQNILQGILEICEHLPLITQ